MTPVILASQSAPRAALLAAAGVVFRKVASGVDEEALKPGLLARGLGPREVAEALAEAKALRVSAEHPGLVIGADQTLDLGGALHDKVATLEAAADRLRAYRGGEHSLHAALSVARNGTVIWRHVATSRLWVRSFSEAFLDAYLALEGEALLSSVACYRLEGPGAQLFERIEGDYFAILGLPLTPLLDLLRREGALSE
jgi:septum formation protein